MTIAAAYQLEIAPVGDRELRLARFFDAPPQLVFDAFTKPELVRRWLLGPDGWTMPVCEIDLRPGGRFRYVWANPEEGTRMGMTGAYREVEAPARIVHTEIFDVDWTMGETVVTTSFVASRGGTAYQSIVRYQSPEGRAAATASGMESGLQVGYDRLARLLGEVQQG